ncbi:conjugative transposon protein TraN [Myroides pelagicus]|uniref:conjugative transposon protein TraN n=1 Tax=Myroides pelagicus TaxID=270914 RepID=UPI002DBC623C|nr:conjugative transposon protein TraN [Myroides pelagicus]MEC4113428.1 conjugative transposon protein TraN [Myroides pelagicus]
MKTILTTAAIYIIFISSYGFSQESVIDNKLEMARISPYDIEVTQNNTTHILFSNSIKYVDLGSSELIAQRVDVSNNVLRLKAVDSLMQPTNFTVITSQGDYYSFGARYSKNPKSLSYDLQKLKTNKDNYNTEAFISDLGELKPSLNQVFIQNIFKHGKNDLHLYQKDYQIKIGLKNIYTLKGKLYFHVFIENHSNLSFMLDSFSFKVVDRKRVKNTTIQKIDLKPIRSYGMIDEILPHQVVDMVFVLNQYPLSNKKLLLIQAHEVNGFRDQELKVKTSDILKAKQLSKFSFK